MVRTVKILTVLIQNFPIERTLAGNWVGSRWTRTHYGKLMTPHKRGRQWVPGFYLRTQGKANFLGSCTWKKWMIECSPCWIYQVGVVPQAASDNENSNWVRRILIAARISKLKAKCGSHDTSGKIERFIAGRNQKLNTRRSLRRMVQN